MSVFEKINLFLREKPRIRRCIVLMSTVILIGSLKMQAVGALPDVGSLNETSSKEEIAAAQDVAPEEETASSEEAALESAEEIASQADIAGTEDDVWSPPTNLSEILGDKENWPGLDERAEGVLKDTEKKQDEAATTVFTSNPASPDLNKIHAKKDEKIVVFTQTDKDFAKRDKNGILRNEDGSVAKGSLLRYIGIDESGRIIFTAGADGNIYYKKNTKLYFNKNKNKFYSDKALTVGITGIEGVLDSAGLALDSESIITLLDLVDGTLATVEVPGKNIYPKQLVDKKTGKKLTKQDIKKNKIPEKRIKKKDPKDRTYLIWKAKKKDRKYAPKFADYICSNEKGGILFYADTEGRIFYNAGSTAMYNGKYFFALKNKKGESISKNEFSKSELVTVYDSLGFGYPDAGEPVRFAMDGKAFEVALYDTREGAKGRYLCRNITKELRMPGQKYKKKDRHKISPKDDSVVCMMDEFGTVLYAVDDYIWQYIDTDIDYALMARQVADGTLKRLRGEYNNYGMLDNQHHLPGQEEEAELTEEQMDELIRAVEAAEAEEAKKAQELAKKEEEKAAEEAAEKKNEEDSVPKEVEGLTRADFDDDWSWEQFAEQEMKSDKSDDSAKEEPKSESAEAKNEEKGDKAAVQEKDGLTRADFDDDWSWEQFLKGE